MKPPFEVGLYITYRAIHNIGSYYWLLQKGLLNPRFCITVYLIRDIHYHAYESAVKLYTYIPIHPYMLYPYRDKHGITVYTNMPYRCVHTIHLYSVSANTGYTPIRCGCVYAYRLILFHGV